MFAITTAKLAAERAAKAAKAVMPNLAVKSVKGGTDDDASEVEQSQYHKEPESEVENWHRQCPEPESETDPTRYIESDCDWPRCIESECEEAQTSRAGDSQLVGLARLIRQEQRRLQEAGEIVAEPDPVWPGTEGSQELLLQSPPTPPTPKEQSTRNNSPRTQLRELTRALKEAKLGVIFPFFAADLLHECLGELRRHPAASLFVNAPLSRPSLDGFLDVVTDVVDLGVVEGRLSQGSYKQKNGYVKFELFWADIAKCWDTCTNLYVVQEMRVIAATLEDRFWQTLADTDPVAQERSEDWDVYLKNVDFDRMLRGWCRESLRGALLALKSHPMAESFLAPVQWKELGLPDYPKVVPDPIDLGAIGAQMRAGRYWNAAGVDAELFWEDVARCWDNCKRYFDYDSQLEEYQVADRMQKVAERIEATYWADFTELNGGKAGAHSAPALSAVLRRDAPSVSSGSRGAVQAKDPSANKKRRDAEAMLDEEVRRVVEQSADMDRLIHDWCCKQLCRCMQTLLKMARESGIRRVLLQVEALDKRLSAGAFEQNADGLIDPELFWTEVKMCWCPRGKPSKAEQGLLESARAIEDKFYEALEEFEMSVYSAEQKLSSVA